MTNTNKTESSVPFTLNMNMESNRDNAKVRILMDAVSKSGRTAQEYGIADMTMDEIDEEIAQVRRDRRKVTV